MRKQLRDDGRERGGRQSFSFFPENSERVADPVLNAGQLVQTALFEVAAFRLSWPDGTASPN